MTSGSGKKPGSKRRSIFRSPGTASSPDLATLVRKAKEAKATGKTNVNGTSNGIANAQAGPSGSNGSAKQYPTRHAPPPPVPTSQSMGPGTSLASAANGNGTIRGGTMSPPQPGRTLSRTSRTTSASVSGSEDGWDRFSDLKSLPSSSPEKMATIAERPGTRSRESSHNSLEGAKVSPSSPSS